MQYISTRGDSPALDFLDVVRQGLAPDGGLYVPQTVPRFTPAQIAELAGLPYAALARRIMEPFIDGAIEAAVLGRLIDTATANFRHHAVAPLTQIGHRHFLLELFHGPTLAFKDFALQLLGPLLGTLTAGQGGRAIVLGATSGDTGSAAIAGCAGLPGLAAVILYPQGRTSEVQRRQMTTVPDANVHPLAIDGTFDDCQDIVKALFSDAALRRQQTLLAVNSINWARVLAQVVYYFYAALALGAPATPVRFCVPTGNFGDIYAGHIARRMGLPMGPLLIATNRNDILARCVAHGTYAMHGVQPSLSPSMDIEVSSNFERLLFELFASDAAALGTAMRELRSSRTLTLTPPQLRALQSQFEAHACDDALTVTTMRTTYAQCGVLLDPHTATAVAAVAARPFDGVQVSLATAHPAKFPDAVREATGVTPPLPAHLQGLFTRPERLIPMPARAEAVADYLRNLS